MTLDWSEDRVAVNQIETLDCSLKNTICNLNGALSKMCVCVFVCLWCTVFVAEGESSLHLWNVLVWKCSPLCQHRWHGQKRWKRLGPTDSWNVWKGSSTGPFQWHLHHAKSQLERCLTFLLVSFCLGVCQIFKLMKMDSYRRFVRSPVYQSCTLSSVEGKRLPPLSAEPFRTVSWEDVANRSPNLSDKKVAPGRERR